MLKVGDKVKSTVYIVEKIPKGAKGVIKAVVTKNGKLNYYEVEFDGMPWVTFITEKELKKRLF